MGEFQKRIEKEFKTAYDACYSTTFADCFQHFGGQSMIAGMIDTGLKPNVQKIVGEAKKEFGDVEWLEELKQYILKHSIKLTGDTPVFSARHFASKIAEHKEKLEKWFGE